MSVGSAQDVLRVRRWRNEVLVPRDRADHDDLRDRVQRAMESDLERALSTVIASAASQHGSIVFVREIHVDWAVDVTPDTASVARRCALALTREVAAELASPSPDNVVRFDSRAEYIASYVAARATGATAWFYSTFDGWSALPSSAAIRAALCEDTVAGLAALRTLSEANLYAVAGVLQDEDGGAIVRALAAHRDPLSPEALRSMLAAGPSLALLERPGLPVWLLAHATEPTSASAIGQASAIVFALHHAAAARGILLDDAFRVTCDNPDVLRALVASTTAGQQGTAQRVAASAIAGAAWDSQSHATTWFGGVFLLLGDLDELPWQEFVASPDVHTTSAVSVLKLSILGEALGDLSRVFADPFWRDRFGVGPEATISEALNWLQDVCCEGMERFAHMLTGAPGDLLEQPVELPRSQGPLPERWAPIVRAAAARVLQGFARRIPGFAASSADFLRENFLSIIAAVDFEENRIAVTLSRPPLDLILRVAGVNRGVRDWEWLDRRPFMLFSEEP